MQKQLFSFSPEDYLAWMKEYAEQVEAGDEIRENLNYIEVALNRVMLEAKLYNRLTDLKKPIDWLMIVDPFCLETTLKLPYFMAMAESSDSIDMFLLPHPLHKEETQNIQGEDYPAFPMIFLLDEDKEEEFKWLPRSKEEQSFMSMEEAEEHSFEKQMDAYKMWFNKIGNQYMQRDFIQLSKDWK